MTATDLEKRSLTDENIVELACFPLLEPGEATAEDGAIAKLMNIMSMSSGNPLALVIWPTGVKAVIMAHAGERTGAARDLMIAAYRAAEAGSLGRISLEAR